MDGKRVGHHTSRFVGRVTWPGVEAYHFQGSLLLDVPQLGDVKMRSSADLWTDELGHPIRFVQQILLGESYSRVELEVAGPSSKAIVVQGSTRREIPLSVDPEAYLLANNFVSHIEILLALRQADAQGTFRLFSASTLQGLPYS